MYDKILKYLIVVIAVEHIWLAISGLFFWKKSLAADLFDYDAEQAEQTAPLARIFSGYNVVLAAGYIWTHLLGREGGGIVFTNAIFFFGASLTVALAAAFSGCRKLAVVQGVPALAGFGIALFIWY